METERKRVRYDPEYMNNRTIRNKIINLETFVDTEKYKKTILKLNEIDRLHTELTNRKQQLDDIMKNYEKTFHSTIKDYEEKLTKKITDITNGGLCIICNENPRNASIIHDDSAHTVCCFKCSQSILDNKCIVCRRQIEKIVRNFIC